MNGMEDNIYSKIIKSMLYYLINSIKQFCDRRDIMIALAGTIQGNTVIIENDNITNYDGKEVILTILDRPYKKARKKLTGISMVWRQNVENMSKSIWRK